MTVSACFGSEQPHGATGHQRPESVDERVHEVAVPVTPPQHDDLDHVVGILVEEVGTDGILDGIAQFMIDIGVITELLHGLSRLQTKAGHRTDSPRAFRGPYHLKNPLAL